MKTLAIDLRWIDSSGVGMYIEGILPGIVERLSHVLIVGIGDRSRLEQFPWAMSPNVRLIDCRAGRYSFAEQIQLPLTIPSNTDLFFSPYYTIPLLYRVRLAVTVHDLSHRVVPEIVGNPKKRIYAQLMYRALRKRASAVFTVSDFSKAELLRLTVGPRKDNIVTTPLGISDEWYTAADLPPVRSRPYFVHVGNIKPYKNLGRLVEAFLSIRHRVPHDLVIVGQSKGLITGESPDFFERVRAASNRIHLTGLRFLPGYAFASRPRGRAGYALSLRGVWTSPIEAMAAGTPVAVARAASLPEVCGDAALYFDPLRVGDIAEKMLLIASDTEQARKFGHKGIERSRLFTWESCSRKTADALRWELEMTKPTIPVGAN